MSVNNGLPSTNGTSTSIRHGNSTASTSVHVLLSKVQKNLTRMSSLQDATLPQADDTLVKMKKLTQQNKESHHISSTNDHSLSLPAPISASILVERLTKTESALDQIVSMFRDFQKQSQKEKQTLEQRISLLERRLEQQGVNLKTEKKLEQMDAAITARIQALESRQRHNILMTRENETESATLSKLSSDVRAVSQNCQREVDHIAQEFTALKGTVLRIQSELSATEVTASEAQRSFGKIKQQFEHHERLMKQLGHSSDHLQHRLERLEHIVETNYAYQQQHSNLRDGRVRRRIKYKDREDSSDEANEFRMNNPVFISSSGIGKEWNNYNQSNPKMQTRNECISHIPEHCSKKSNDFKPRHFRSSRAARTADVNDDEDSMSRLSMDSLSGLSGSSDPWSPGISQSTIDRMRESFLQQQTDVSTSGSIDECISPRPSASKRRIGPKNLYVPRSDNFSHLRRQDIASTLYEPIDESVEFDESVSCPVDTRSSKHVTAQTTSLRPPHNQSHLFNKQHVSTGYDSHSNHIYRHDKPQYRGNQSSASVSIPSSTSENIEQNISTAEWQRENKPSDTRRSKPAIFSRREDE